MHDRYFFGDVRYNRCPHGGHTRAPEKKSGGIFGLLPAGADSSDILLLLILYFLYKESGDEEFLIILAVVALSVFGEK